MRVLITGGSGFVGGAVARAMIGAGHGVVVADKSAAEDTAGLIFEVLDVTDGADLERVISEHPCDVILHAAAMPSVASCARDPIAACDVNVAGTVRTIRAAAKSGIRRVVIVSTEEVYGEFSSAVADETHPTVPASVYGCTKLAAEHFARVVCLTEGIEPVAARLSWAYGPGYPRHRLPRTMILDALAGRTTRLPSGADHRVDLTYIEDVAQAFRLLIESPVLEHQVYNVGTGVSYSTVEIASAVQDLLPSWRFEIGPGLLTADDGTPLPQKGALRIGRLSELGYAPRITLADGLRREHDAIVAGQPGRLS